MILHRIRALASADPPRRAPRGARVPTRAELNRRQWCRQKAIAFTLAYAEARPLAWVLRRISRRWPASVGRDRVFLEKLMAVYRGERAFCGLPDAESGALPLISTGTTADTTPDVAGSVGR